MGGAQQSTFTICLGKLLMKLSATACNSDSGKIALQTFCHFLGRPVPYKLIKFTTLGRFSPLSLNSFVPFFALWNNVPFPSLWRMCNVDSVDARRTAGELPCDMFQRVHQSCAVNLSHRSSQIWWITVPYLKINYCICSQCVSYQTGQTCVTDPCLGHSYTFRFWSHNSTTVPATMQKFQITSNIWLKPVSGSNCFVRGTRVPR